MSASHVGRTRIKICGITSRAAADAAIASGADALGFVFAADSPRAINIKDALEITAPLPPFITTVAVYRDATRATFTDRDGDHLMFDALQLHGNEDEALLNELHHPCIVRGSAFSRDAVMRWNQVANVSALLVDASTPGSGRSFDHAGLAALMPSISKPVIIAGGLRANNVGEAIRTVRPYAVDVSSGVESAPGEKDASLIEAFCAAVRKADAAM